MHENYLPEYVTDLPIPSEPFLSKVSFLVSGGSNVRTLSEEVVLPCKAYGLNKYGLWCWGSRLGPRAYLLPISVQKIGNTNSIDSPMLIIKLQSKHWTEGQLSQCYCFQLLGVSDKAATLVHIQLMLLEIPSQPSALETRGMLTDLHVALLFLHNAYNTITQWFKSCPIGAGWEDLCRHLSTRMVWASNCSTNGIFCRIKCGLQALHSDNFCPIPIPDF